MSGITLRIVALGMAALGAGQPDFAFLQPWFSADRGERDTLARRGVVVRSLPATQRQLSVIATCAVNAAPEALVAAVASGASGVGTGGMFSTPPALHDLSALTLDQGDIDRLRQCRPGSCALNLADDEMSALQRAMQTSESTVHEAFRRVLLERLRRYQSGGLAALPDYRDRRDPVQPAAVFSSIVQQIPFLRGHVPAAANYLEQYPRGASAPAESRVGWSKVTMNGKPVIMLTHRTVFKLKATPTVPGVLVATKQVYASRYMNGELSLTMLFAGAPGASGYLVVTSRSDLDELAGGMFTGLKRSMFESRIEDEAVKALTRLRDRIERGNSH